MNQNNRYLHLVRHDCPLTPGTHVVVYCRDSGGEEQDRSVSQQVETAREYCQHHNLVLEKVYIDEARLSSNTEKRDALQEMLFDLCLSVATVMAQSEYLYGVCKSCVQWFWH